jgi:hypothetical protein
MTPRSGLSWKSAGESGPCFLSSFEENRPPSGMPAPLFDGWMTAVIFGFKESPTALRSFERAG